MMAPEADKKILVVLHQAHSTPGRVGQLLTAMGYRLDARYPALGCELPKTLEGYAGAVVFGGPMCANDEHDWLKREIDWLAVPLRERKPYLGLCLGAQLMARQLGARVYCSERGEHGYFPLRPTPEADALCATPFPRHAFQWHRDGFDLPSGAHRLAEGEGEFPNQAFIYGDRAVALQFHPEVTYQMICRWTTRGAAKLAAADRRPHELRAGWYQHDSGLESWIGAFLRPWAQGALGWREPAEAYAMAAE